MVRGDLCRPQRLKVTSLVAISAKSKSSAARITFEVMDKSCFPADDIEGDGLMGFAFQPTDLKIAMPGIEGVTYGSRGLAGPC